ncbi:hypothetical protein ACLQ3C_06215 [Gordonia sp. DT30]|uniref:hypothetical protein n=1 Tax=unclassified Gordonia (in: high G+C Gram-positive bacteria) TaxID=2657482 RepID=UPI003CF68340
MTGATTTDPTMNAIIEAVTDGRSGNVDNARTQLLDLWQTIGVTGDPLHRCTLAHYLADLYIDPAQALQWDVRALDAADAVSEQRARELDAGLHIAGFYPSLHLNLADNFRRLGSFDAARDQLASARERSFTLQADSYGDLIRVGIEEVAAAVKKRDTAPRAWSRASSGTE